MRLHEIFAVVPTNKVSYHRRRLPVSRSLNTDVSPTTRSADPLDFYPRCQLNLPFHTLLLIAYQDLRNPILVQPYNSISMLHEEDV